MKIALRPASRSNGGVLLSGFLTAALLIGGLLVMTGRICAATYTFTKIADSDGSREFGARPAINDAGTAAFYETGVPTGHFTGSGAGIATIAVLSGQFISFNFPDPASINASGTVAFSATTNINGANGIFTGNGGATTTLADSSGPLLYLTSPAINSSGAVAFLGQSDMGSLGVFSSTGGPVTTIANNSGQFNRFFLSAGGINNAGTVAFSAFRDNNSRGIFSGSGGSVTTIIDDSGEFSAFDPPAINSSGTVAFTGVLDNGRTGVFTTEGGAATTIADDSGPFKQFFESSINASGTVAFLATRDIDGDFAPAHLFAKTGSTTDRVIGLGDTLFGSNVIQVTIGHQSLNDDGEIAFRYHLENGATGIAVAKPSTGIGDLITWTGPANLPPGTPPSGLFGTNTNWNPQQLPEKSLTRADIAVFDLPAQYSVLVGTASSEKLVITGGPAAHVTFTNANYTVAATSFDEPGVVINGGKLTLESGKVTNVHTLVGLSAASQMEITDSGEWVTTGSLRVGGPGEGMLSITDGGTVTSGEARIGSGSALTSEANVSGMGSKWTTGSLAVGFDGLGILEIKDKASVVSGEVRVGSGVGGGLAFVRDVGTKWTTGIMEVGYSQEGGSLTVLDGSELTSTDANIGSGGADARAAIQGEGSKWKITETLGVGNTSEGGLSVLGGGLVRIDGFLIVGRNAKGTVHLSGASAGTPSGIVMNSSDAYIGIGGFGASGTIKIEQGAGLSALQAAVQIGGTAAGATGELTIDGLGSFFSCEELFVGGAGKGTIMVKNGAGLSTYGNAKVGTNPSGNGEVYVDGSGTEWFVVGDLIVGRGGAGSVFLENATIVVEGGFTVDAMGAVTGTGTLSAPNRAIHSDAYISPGLSPGKLTIAGNYEQGPTGILEIEIGGLEAETEYDQFVVTGDADVDGSLLLSFINGFLPRTGDVFDFLDVGGSLNGEFNQVQIEGIHSDWDFEFTLNEQGLQLRSLSDAVPILPGDFNNDGSVDAADYVVWRKSLSTPDGYNLWWSNFGRTAGSPLAAAVPEPASCAVYLTGMLAIFRFRRQVAEFSSAP